MFGFPSSSILSKVLHAHFSASREKKEKGKGKKKKRGGKKTLRNVLCLLRFESICLQRAIRGYADISKWCGIQQLARCSGAAGAASRAHVGTAGLLLHTGPPAPDQTSPLNMRLAGAQRAATPEASTLIQESARCWLSPQTQSNSL